MVDCVQKEILFFTISRTKSIPLRNDQKLPKSCVLATKYQNSNPKSLLSNEKFAEKGISLYKTSDSQGGINSSKSFVHLGGIHLPHNTDPAAYTTCFEQLYTFPYPIENFYLQTNEGLFKLGITESSKGAHNSLHEFLQPLNVLVL